MFKQTPWRVQQEGTAVALKIGSDQHVMDYDTCLAIAAAMRLEGRKARRLAGDTGMKVRVIGQLSDAEADERLMQQHRDATAAFRR